MTTHPQACAERVDSEPNPKKAIFNRRLLWVLFVFLAVRSVANDFVLEPFNDEGTWVWNARCDYWGLPDYGILQIALSPLSYFLDRALYEITAPSILASRLLNSTFILMGVGTYLAFCSKRREEIAGLAFLLWLLFDPFLFRMASWVLLEPRLFFLMVVLYVTRQIAIPRRALIEGLLIGALVALKVTVIWLYGGIAIVYCIRGDWKSLKEMTLAFVITLAILYGTVYAIFDHQRFVEIWQIHTVKRFSPGTGLWQDILSKDVRVYFYLLTISAFFAAGLRRPYAPSVLIPALVGALFAVVQHELPDRYLFPLSLWCVLEFLTHHKQGLTFLRGYSLKLILLAVIVANGLYAEVLIQRSKYAGGKYLTGEIAEAVARNETVAAPPSLSVQFNYPIEPTSIGALTNYVPPGTRVPALYIYQSVAAEPSPSDRIYEPIFQAMQVIPDQIGFYRRYSMAHGR